MKTRNTFQRQIIIKAIEDLNTHPTATEVYNFIHKTYPNISKATVFRIMQQEVEMGTLKKVITDDKETHYDLILKPHYHLRCIKCGKIIDLNLTYQKDIDEMLLKTSNFVVFSHTMLFQGLCLECAKKKEEQNE